MFVRSDGSFRLVRAMLIALLLSAVAGVAGAAKPYSYYAVGSVGDPVGSVAPHVALDDPRTPSYVLMGGGPDVDDAFRWMIARAGITKASGGRLVVIRATGDGAYDPYIYFSNANSSTESSAIVDGWVGGASLGLTSVETLVIPNAAAANDDTVNAIVANANAVWIAGGDQSDYIKYWKGQKLERTLAALTARNVPIGGTSAGLMVLGQFDFAALNGSVTSTQALDNPYNKYMTIDPTRPDGSLSLTGGFIAPPGLANTITDAHLDARDRMGRLIAFVSRLIAPYRGGAKSFYGCTGGVLGNAAAKGIGIGVETALLVQGNPNGSYTGRRVTNVSTTTESAVYFVSVTQGPTVCLAGKPLDVPTSSVEIRKLADSNLTFDLSNWASFPVYKSVGVAAGVLLGNPY